MPERQEGAPTSPHDESRNPWGKAVKSIGLQDKVATRVYSLDDAVGLRNSDWGWWIIRTLGSGF